MDQQSLVGEYYLAGVPEMASGFKLDPDNTFQFFLMYGALDRYGSGEWKEGDGRVIFQSKPWSGKDFALVESKVVEDNAVVIKITDANDEVLRHVQASLKGMEGTWQPADESGIIQFQKQDVVSGISLVFAFCPERFSVFRIDNPLHNYYEFRFEPWIVEYFFDDFQLEIMEEGLKGAHPMMDGKDFYYERH
jgi:hypothetical protein